MPIAELLDAVRATAETSEGHPVVTRHPLQPFDIENVRPGSLIPDRPFSFDRTVLDTAEAMAGRRRPQPSFVSGPLPDTAVTTSICASSSSHTSGPAVESTRSTAARSA